MSENIEPTADETDIPAVTDETAEVEAHSSILDKQGLAGTPSLEGSCVSTLSITG